MKKIIAIALAVVLVIAAFAMVGPVSAGPPSGGRAVFEADIVPTSWGTQSLDKGEVYVREDGSVKVEIEGAQPDTTYRVFFGQQPAAPQQISDWTLGWTSIGTFTTDDNGKGELPLPAGSIPGTIVPGPVMAPAFAINHPELTFTQFVTGF